MSDITRVENKIDSISERISSIDTTLAAQHVSLREHIRRTTLLERQMEPVQKHVAMVSGALKFIGLVAAFAAIGEGIVVVLDFLGK